MLHLLNDSGRRSVAAARPLALAALLLLASGAVAGQLEKIPVYKVSPQELFRTGGQAGDPAAQQLRADRLQERYHDVHQLLHGNHVSLRSRNELAARGMVPRLGVANKLVESVTLRVLLVRISFETDVSGDLTSLTTDGDFQYEPIEGQQIEPAPHDKAFFQSHLRGLSEYYRIQSGGRLEIDGRVLPEGDTDSYKLSDMADYGPGAGGGWTLELLENLVQDIILETDRATQEDGSVVLADYGDDHPLTYVIFVHAGADWQSDINRDSPNDIPTFFVTLGEPVAITGGSLSECSIIPESTTQDDWLGSIAGALYHEFGHALGLVDVYDTTTGLPAVGLWDLMDSGPNLIANVGLAHPTIPDSIEVYSVAGLLPPSLGVWNKWLLGWVDVGIVSGDEAEVHLPAVQVPRSDYYHYSGNSVAGQPFDFEPVYPQALIGGASSEEFFLVENRWVPLTSAELPDVTGIGFVRDPDTRVFLYMGGDEIDPDGPGPLPPTPRNTGMYDFFLPDGGLLVWHVNQARIRERMDENTINGLGDGLRLLEADGIQDVGVYEPYVFGFYGSARDPFHAGTSDALYGEGRPSSRAYDRSWTGFELRDISAQGATMTFQAQVAPLTPTARFEIPGDTVGQRPRRLEPSTLTPLRITAEGQPVDVFVCADSGLPADAALPAEDPVLWMLDRQGSPILNTPPSGPAGAALLLTSPLAGPPALLTLPSDDRTRLVAGTRDGTVRAWLDLVVAGNWLPVFNVDVADSLPFAPVATLGVESAPRIVCLTGDGDVVVLDGTGTERLRVTVPGLAGGSAGPFTSPPRLLGGTTTAGGYVVSTTAARGVAVPLEPDGPLAPHFFDLGVAPVEGRFRTALLRSDTGYRFLVIGDRVEAWELEFDGDALAPPHASAWSAGLRGEPLGEPAVADLDGDGRDDLILATTYGVEAFARNGVALTGYPRALADAFPLEATVRLDGALVVFDQDGDRRNEVFAVTDHGHLFGWDAGGRLLDRLPQRIGAAGRHALLLGDNGDGAERTLWLAAAGGAEALGLGATEVDGAVSGWLPVAGAAVTDGTAEWRGPLGGVNRSGPVGTLRDLGAASTLSAETDHFFAYPNPASGDAVVFRYFGAVPGTARLTIYNLEGEVVASLVHEGGGGALEELPWRLDGLASGVYLCRLSVPAETGVTTRILRLAVER